MINKPDVSQLCKKMTEAIEYIQQEGFEVRVKSPNELLLLWRVNPGKLPPSYVTGDVIISDKWEIAVDQEMQKIRVFVSIEYAPRPKDIKLHYDEFYLLHSLLNDHVIRARKQCDEDGSSYHDGIQFCEKLSNKLIPFMHPHRDVVISQVSKEEAKDAPR